MLGMKTLFAALFFTVHCVRCQRLHAKGLTVDDMLAMQRVSDPQVSPDGKWVAFAVRDTDYDANRGRYDVWLAAIDGSAVTRLTTASRERHGSAVVARRQVGLLHVDAQRARRRCGGSSRPAARPSRSRSSTTDINGFKLMPDGKRLVLAIDVWPDAKTLADSVKRDETKSKSKVKARVYDQLLFRHWDQWEDGKYSHLFVWTQRARRRARPDAGPRRPTRRSHPFGGMEEVAISPDGKSLAYVARVGGREIAWTTNTDVFLVATDGKRQGRRTSPPTNKAYDFDPAFSPDGKSIAFTAMKRPGFEADRQRITIYDVATQEAARRHRELGSLGRRRSRGARDGKTIYTTPTTSATQSLFAIDVASGNAKTLVDKGTNNSARVAGDRHRVRAATR